jgi:uncharacterized Ntn-hydrolase superfamily protein
MAARSPVVGNRCSFVYRSGALAFQSVVEPRLGALGLRLLALGYSAQKVCEELLSTDPGGESRQIGVVDADGRTAAYTGAEDLSWAGHVMGDGFVAMGNVLAGKEVADAIAEECQTSGAYTFEDSLLRAVEAGRDAGGQEEGQCSARLLTFGRDEFSRAIYASISATRRSRSCVASKTSMLPSCPTTSNARATTKSVATRIS